MDAEQESPPDAHVRVLVADGDLNQREWLAMLFESHGHQATSVGDGNACVEAMRNQRYDVLVLDAALPIMDGVMTAVAVRARSVRTKIFFYTAAAERSVRQRFTAYDGFFRKGADARTLLAEIGKVKDSATSKLAPSPETKSPRLDESSPAHTGAHPAVSASSPMAGKLMISAPASTEEGRARALAAVADLFEAAGMDIHDAPLSKDPRKAVLWEEAKMLVRGMCGQYAVLGFQAHSGPLG